MLSSTGEGISLFRESFTGSGGGDMIGSVAWDLCDMEIFATTSRWGDFTGGGGVTVGFLFTEVVSRGSSSKSSENSESDSFTINSLFLT